MQSEKALVVQEIQQTLIKSEDAPTSVSGYEKAPVLIEEQGTQNQKAFAKRWNELENCKHTKERQTLAVKYAKWLLNGKDGQYHSEAEGDTIKVRDAESSMTQLLSGSLVDENQRRVAMSVSSAYEKGGVVLELPVGSGKTRIAILIGRMRGGLLLVFAPMTILNQWQEEVTTMCPEANVFVLHGERKMNDEELLHTVIMTSDFQVVLTTLETAYSLSKRTDAFRRLAQKANTFVIDEAQRALRKEENKMHKFVRELEFRKIGLTATPLINQREEILPLLRALDPSFHSEQKKISSSEMECLKKNYFVSCTKEEMGIVSAEVRMSSVYVPFDDEDVSAYKSCLEHLRKRHSILMNAKRRGLWREEREAFLKYMCAITNLRVCNVYPYLMEIMKHSDDSLTRRQLVADAPLTSRLDAILTLLKKQKVPTLVFCEFPSIFPVLTRFLTEDEVACTQITGSMSAISRSQAVSAFNQDGGPRILLISMKAGGVGLDLAKADTVIFLNTPMSPADITQAVGRADRRTRGIRPIDCIFVRSVGDTGAMAFTTHTFKSNMSSEEGNRFSFVCTALKFTTVREEVKCDGKSDAEIYLAEKDFYCRKSRRIVDDDYGVGGDSAASASVMGAINTLVSVATIEEDEAVTTSAASRGVSNGSTGDVGGAGTRGLKRSAAYLENAQDVSIEPAVMSSAAVMNMLSQLMGSDDDDDDEPTSRS